MPKSKMEINSAGTKSWRNPQVQRHNEDGPAWISTDGSKSWGLNGKLHRENGPAVIHSDGDKIWWIDGEEIYE